MRRAFVLFAMLFLLVAMSGRDAQAKLWFGTQDTIHHLKDIEMKGPKGEALYLGYLTSRHNFMLPYSLSDGGHVLGIKGVNGKYFKLPKEKVELFQRGGVLPTPLPTYRRSTVDYAIGYALWPVLLIIGVAAFFSSRGRGSVPYGAPQSA